jgi:hypothetical protein
MYGKQFPAAASNPPSMASSLIRTKRHILSTDLMGVVVLKNHRIIDGGDIQLTRCITFARRRSRL